MQQTYLRSAIFLVLIAVLYACGNTQKTVDTPEYTTVQTSGSSEHTYEATLFMELPESCNTPDGLALAPDGNLILACPNFNSKTLFKDKIIDTAYPPILMKIDKSDELSIWYQFIEEDFENNSRSIGPMDIAFGPDGHVYFADNQFFLGGNLTSRIMRLKVKDGMPDGNCEVLVEGLRLPNGMEWHENALYITETLLTQIGEDEQGNRPPNNSAIYSFDLEELNTNNPIHISEYDSLNPDKHLVTIVKSFNVSGFGADGITFDDDGFVYTGTFEEGKIFRVKPDTLPGPQENEFFVSLGDSTSCDGIIWNDTDKKIYAVDMVNNAILSIDKNKNISVIHENDDSNGADGGLDQPCEIIKRGNDLIIVNMDSYYEDPLHILKNTAIDKPFSLTKITLP